MAVGWIRAHVGDSRVDGRQHARFAPDVFEEIGVRNARRTFVTDRLGIGTGRSQISEQFDGKVLVELEPHSGRSGRRLSSRASSAAQVRAASMWTGFSVG